MSRTRCSAKRCAADAGPSQTHAFVKVPVLQRIAARCAAPGTRAESPCSIIGYQRSSRDRADDCLRRKARDRKRGAGPDPSGRTRRMTEKDAIRPIERGLPQTQRAQSVIGLIDGACWLPLCWRPSQPSLWPFFPPHRIPTALPMLSSQSTPHRQLPWLHLDQKKLCPSRARQTGSSLAGSPQCCTAVSKCPGRCSTRRRLPPSSGSARCPARRYFSYFGAPRRLRTAPPITSWAVRGPSHAHL